MAKLTAVGPNKGRRRWHALAIRCHYRLKTRLVIEIQVVLCVYIYLQAAVATGAFEVTDGDVTGNAVRFTQRFTSSPTAASPGRSCVLYYGLWAYNR